MLTDADRLLAKYASENDGVFTLADAKSCGLTRYQVRERVAGDWITCYEGVFRIAGAPETWFGRLRTATAAAAPHGAISHRSASAIYGTPGGRTDLVELTCPRWLRSKHPTLHVHESRRLEEQDLTTIEGILVVSAERMVIDLASVWPSTNFLESVIQAARRKRLITHESMDAMFRRHARRGVRGVPALRTALERWDPGTRATESEMETLLIQVLRAQGCPEPVTQYEVLDRAGALVARVDAAISDWRIVIEYDSKQEHSDEFQIARDARRRNRIIAAGFAPLVARHGDLLQGGDDLYQEIINTRMNWRPTVG